MRASISLQSPGDLASVVWRGLRVPEGWLSVFLLIAVMLSTVWAVEGASWVGNLPSLGWIALAAMAFGLVFAKMRMRAFILHPVAFIYGLGVVVWQTMTVINLPTWDERFVNLVLRLNAWGYAARTGGINNDGLVFVFTLVSLTWLIGYLSVWFVFHSHRIWWGVVPSGVAILTNLRYAPPNVAIWFVVYLLASMLLFIRISFFLQQRDWERSRVGFSPQMSTSYLPTAVVVCIGILIAAWVAPTSAASTLIGDVWRSVNSPWQVFQEDFGRLFASLSSSNEDAGTHFGRTMILKGPVNLSSRISMLVSAEEAHYWRAISYDTYAGRGWVNSDRIEVPTRQYPSLASLYSRQYQQRKEITQTVTLRSVKGDIVVGAGQPLRVNLYTTAETIKVPVFTVDLAERSSDFGLPFDLRPYADRIRRQVERAKADRTMASAPWPTSVVTDLPAEYEVVRLVGRDSSTVTGVELARAGQYSVDIAALRAPQRLKKDQEYTVVSSVSTATERQLRTAGTGYPTWVLERYLQAPANFPIRVVDLAKLVTKDAASPYDKTMAVQDYLRKLKYNQNIDAPPATMDPVEYFLFDVREGYCDYYASAMVMMLRSVGIPARIATGYLTGTYDEKAGVYVVREANAHSWPEVFFPRYGWIEFEPTASVAPISRPSDVESIEVTTPDDVSGSDDSAAVEELMEDDLLLDGNGAVVIDGAKAVPLAAGTVALLVMGALLALVWMGWQRSVSRLALPSQVYEKMCRLAGYAGLGPAPTQTPYEYSDYLGRSMPEHEGDVARIAGAYTSARFGRKRVVEAEPGGIERSWRRVRSRLLRRIIARR